MHYNLGQVKLEIRKAARQELEELATEAWQAGVIPFYKFLIFYIRATRSKCISSGLDEAELSNYLHDKQIPTAKKFYKLCQIAGFFPLWGIREKEK